MNMVGVCEGIAFEFKYELGGPNTDSTKMLSYICYSYSGTSERWEPAVLNVPFDSIYALYSYVWINQTITQ